MRMTPIQYVLGLSLALLVSASPAWAIDFTSTSGGSFVQSTFDTNGDGFPGAESESTGYSTAFGAFTGQGFGDPLVVLDDEGNPVLCTMPNGNPGLEFFTSNASGVTAQHDTGDTLFLSGTATSCADLTTCYDDEFNLLVGCTFAIETNWDVTGGTGQFAGATGDITVHTEGVYTAVSPVGGFGQSSHRSEWSLNLADGGDDGGSDGGGTTDAGTNCTVLHLLGLSCP